MADGRDERLVQAQRLGELLALLEQTEKRIGLVTNDARLERLEQKVDRARVVPAKEAMLLLRARRDENDRDVT